MLTRYILLRQIETLKAEEKAYYKNQFDMTTDKYLNFIREKGKYDFFIKPGINHLELYLRLYNKKGKFFANHLWGIFNNWGKILDLCYNIIKYEIED